MGAPRAGETDGHFDDPDEVFDTVIARVALLHRPRIGELGPGRGRQRGQLPALRDGVFGEPASTRAVARMCARRTSVVVHSGTEHEVRMSRSCMWFFVAAICAAASACSDGGATTPTPPGSSFTGEWSGTTSQGVPISFTVSADQTVTSITVGYRFNGCTGSNTFSNLSLRIGDSPFPPRVPTPGSAGFGYGSGPPDGANYTQVQGTFTSNQASTGSVVFLNFGSCGNAVANWAASRR